MGHPAVSSRREQKIHKKPENIFSDFEIHASLIKDASLSSTYTGYLASTEDRIDKKWKMREIGLLLFSISSNPHKHCHSLFPLEIN